VVGGSDGAGEVVMVGAEVTKWRKGDRVTTLFNPGHQAGPLSQAAFEKGGLGGTIDGTFQEYGAFDEDWLVRLAPNLNYVEGAVLSDAAVTAWNALYGEKQLIPGQYVLVQGTGGVSLFAVQVCSFMHGVNRSLRAKHHDQFAKAGGATVVATTSSPQKAELLKRLGADHVINYNETKNW
jgi:NADPH:quinone reductase-like Zn-dependent oxidoreductase